MKCSLLKRPILLVMAMLYFSIGTLAQNMLLNMSNVTVKQAMNELKNKSGYSFVYSAGDIDTNRKVDIKAANVTDAINQILDGQDVAYEIQDKNIIVKKLVAQQKHSPENIVSINGIVLDSKGLPLTGASVIEKGTMNGTQTDVDGKFTMSNVHSGSNLVISFMGYLDKTMTARPGASMKIILEEDSELLNEVVVIGYGTVRKSDLTGSIGSVKAGDINSFPSASMLQTISGKTSGMQVKQNTGAPGGTISVRIRGTNSIQGSNEPLYVIDGFPISGSPTNLNNADIESIEILKDASATAIYGSRGANGVVMITTKQGKSGESRIDFEASYSMQSVIKTLDLMNAKEYAQFYNLEQLNDTGKEFFTSEQIANFGTGYDWQKLLFRKAPIYQTNLSVSGGNDKTQFVIGGSIFLQDGIIEGSDYDRYSLQTKINHKVNRYFTINFTSNLTKWNTGRKDSVGGSRGTSIISSTISAPPTLSPYNSDGNYTELATEYPFIATDIINPINFIKEQSDKVSKHGELANVSLIFNPIPELTIKLLGGLQHNNQNSSVYRTREFLHSTGNASLSLSQFTSLLSENTVTYSKIFGNHSITALGGYTFQNFKTTAVSGSGSGFLSDVFNVYSLQSASTPGIPSSSYSKSVLISYLGRINYSFKNKYLLTVSIRRDGSSVFSQGNKWGNFPSAAFAWKASNENFLKDLHFLNNLKIRTSWGRTGSQAIGAYATLSTLASGRTVFDDALYNTFAPGSRLPGNLKWETTEQYDLGVDIGLWNRIDITVDGYVKNTKDLLNTVVLPSSSGYSSTIKNVGKVQNKGIDLSLDARVLTGPVYWNLAANISFYRNKVKKLYEGEDIYGGQINAIIVYDTSNILREGRPIGQFYGYKENGYDEKGKIIYQDLDKDGTITTKDRTYIGDPNPDFTYGFSSDLSFKNFGLNLFFQGSHGNDLFNASAISNTVDYGYGLNMPKEVYYDHWTESNRNAKYPSISYNTTVKVSDRFVEDGSYLRLRNIQLSYNVPTEKLHWNWVKGIQFYVSGQNLLTITDYSWWDPEVNSYGGSSSTSQGIDFNSYPSSKSYTVGAKIRF